MFTIVFRWSISKIFTPDFTVIHTSLECTWYLYIIVFYALIIFLPFFCSIRFLRSLRAGDRRVGGFFCLWWYRELSLQLHVVPLVAAGLWAWWSPVFSARLAWYLYSFTVTLTSLQCACCVVKLLYYARIIFYSIIIELFFFSHWKQGVVALKALSALVVLWVVSTTNCGATVEGGVYPLDDPCFQCLFNMIFTLDFTVICVHHWNVYDIFLWTLVLLCLDKFSTVSS